MTNYAVVTKLLPEGKAEIEVVRQSACGGNCASCGGCSKNNIMKAVAINKVNAQPGQRVLIESSSSRIFSAVALVYVMPLVFFVASYIIAAAQGLSEGKCILVSFAALAFSAVILVLSQKLKKNKDEIIFNIIEIS